MNNSLKEIQNEIGPFLNNKFENYFSCEFQYIEYPEDVNDLETATCSEDLEEETFNEAMKFIMDSEDMYDIETYSEEDIKNIEDDIHAMIEDTFYKVRDNLVEIWREKFDMEDMVSEMEEYEDW